jgi:hypothetical protein
MKTIAACGIVFLLCTGAFGQAPSQTGSARPEFNVADIKQNKSWEPDIDGGVLPGGQFGVRNMPLKLLLGIAYSAPQRMVDTFVTGAPGWVVLESALPSGPSCIG